MNDKLTPEESWQAVMRSILDECDREELERAGGYVFRYVRNFEERIERLTKERDEAVAIGVATERAAVVAFIVRGADGWMRAQGYDTDVRQLLLDLADDIKTGEHGEFLARIDARERSGVDL